MTIEEIVKNKVDLINIKKIAVKHTDGVSSLPIKENENIQKAIDLGLAFDGLQKVVANTYYWLDSHGDVHVRGCFTQSIKQNLSKIYHLDNHDSSGGFRSKVGNVREIKETTVKWRDLGVDIDGETISLIGYTELIEDYNKQVYNAYKLGQIDQHSVGMQYVNIVLAVNNPEYEEEFKNWNEVYPSLGNKSKADAMGYLWVIREAKLKEYSCLLWNGSNELTPAVKNIEPLEDTQKTEADQVTSKNAKSYLLI